MILTIRKTDSEYVPEIPVFVDVEPELLNFTPRCRVLPAPFYDEPSLNFELIKRYEPGEHPSYPNGGLEVYGPGVEKRSFDLDQVILHPFELKKFNFFKKNITDEVKEKVTDPNKPKGKRGRPAKLDAEGKPIVKEAYVPSGGKRGRPRKLDENGNPIVIEKKEYEKKKKNRGRQKLSEEERVKRKLKEEQKLQERQKLIELGVISGRRGRPSTLTSEQREERRLKEEEKDRLRAEGKLKRGRPSFKKF